jgi:hypothetical protein
MVYRAQPATFAATGLTTQLLQQGRINLKRKLMVVMAVPVISHKLLAITGVINRALVPIQMRSQP